MFVRLQGRRSAPNVTPQGGSDHRGLFAHTLVERCFATCTCWYKRLPAYLAFRPQKMGAIATSLGAGESLL
jgi:hypothetical protein